MGRGRGHGNTVGAANKGEHPMHLQQWENSTSIGVDVGKMRRRPSSKDYTRPLKPLSFDRKETWAQKWNPFQANDTVDPFIVVTMYPTLEQKNTEWIDNIGDAARFKMTDAHRNELAFLLPSDLKTSDGMPIQFEISVYDHDFGFDQDDLIGKVVVDSTELAQHAKRELREPKLFEIKSKEGFSAGDLLVDVRLQYTEGDPDAMARAEKMVAVDEAQKERALARSPSFKALSRATSFNRGSPIRAGSPRTHTEEAGALLSLTVLEGLDIVNPDAVTHVDNAGGYMTLIGTAFLILIGYFCVAMWVYNVQEDWTLLDGLYFTVATFTTVGYGDFGPVTTGGRIFTCFVAFVGIGVISVSVGVIAGFIMAKEAQARRHLTNKIGEATGLLSKQDIEAKNEAARSPAARSPKFRKTASGVEQFSLVSDNEERRERRKVGFGLIKFICVLIFGTVGLLLIEPDNAMLGEEGSPKWVDALYWASITAATVGYGDVHVETERGKVFSICFIFIATVVIAQVVSLPTDIYLSRMRRSAMKKVLNTKMDRVMFERMDKDRSGDLTKFEYLKEMLINLRLVEEPIITSLLIEFDRLDADGSGEITKEDLLMDLREHARDSVQVKEDGGRGCCGIGRKKANESAVVPHPVTPGGGAGGQSSPIMKFMTGDGGGGKGRPSSPNMMEAGGGGGGGNGAGNNFAPLHTPTGQKAGSNDDGLSLKDAWEDESAM